MKTFTVIIIAVAILIGFPVIDAMPASAPKTPQMVNICVRGLHAFTFTEVRIAL